MKCEFCGEEIGDTTLACPHCGSPAPKKAQPPSDVPPAERPSAPPPPAEDRPAAQTPEPPVAAQPPASPPPPPQSAPQAPPGQPAQPTTFEAPLAPLEEDFIAMAEERLTLGEEAERGGSKPVEPSEDIREPTEEKVPGGAAVEQETIELDTKITGGYKGPEASSVAGAGAQTADDPFGLNITEQAPPVGGEREEGRGWDAQRVVNVVRTVIILLVVLTALFFGVYYGFLKKGKTQTSSPVDAVREACTAATDNNSEKLGGLAIQGSAFVKDLQDILRPHVEEGVLALGDFGAKVVSQGKDTATIQITKFTAKEQSTTQGKVALNVLDITEPLKLPTQVNLILKDGRWIISS